jgi:hypothetical protein
MVTQAFVSAVVMGLLVAAVFVAASRLSRESRIATEAATPDRYEPGGGLSELSERPDALGFVFVAVALVAGLVTVAAVGGIPVSLGGNPFSLVMAMLGLLVAAFLFLGPYTIVRQNGLGNAHGIGAGLGGLSVAFLVLVVAQLVYGVV